MARKQREQWLVVLIKPVDGLAAYGPFHNSDDAATWFVHAPPTVFPFEIGDSVSIVPVTTPLLMVPAR